jgi:hypothetical protein
MSKYEKYMTLCASTITVQVMYIGKNFILYTFSEIMHFLLNAGCAQKNVTRMLSTVYAKKCVAHAQLE